MKKEIISYKWYRYGTGDAQFMCQLGKATSGIQTPICVVHGARLKPIIKRLYKGECSRKWEGLAGSPKTSSHDHYIEPALLEELPCGLRVSDLGCNPFA